MRVNILFVNVLFIYMTDPNPHTVFIVPYRNREENKKQFEEYLSSVKTYNKWDDDTSSSSENPRIKDNHNYTQIFVKIMHEQMSASMALEHVLN